MLIDDYRARIDEDETLVRGELAGSGLAGETQRVTALVQRFVLSPLTTQTCIDLADPGAIARSRDYIFAPAVTTWLEWRGDTPGFSPESSRHGLLVDGRGGEGHGAIIVGTTGAAIRASASSCSDTRSCAPRTSPATGREAPCRPDGSSMK